MALLMPKTSVVAGGDKAKRMRRLEVGLEVGKDDSGVKNGSEGGAVQLRSFAMMRCKFWMT